MLADRLTLYRKPDHQQVVLSIDRARIDFAWLSWWQGKPFIQSASVSNADISLPVGEKETVDLKQVNAHFALTSSGVDVLSAEARLLNFQFILQGRLRFKALPSTATTRTEMTPEEKARRDALWSSVQNYLAEFQTERPIKVQGQFDIDIADIPSSTAQLAIQTRYARWRGVQIDELVFYAKLGDGLLSIDDFHLRLARGEFDVYGQWRVTEPWAEIQFNSTLDFTPLGPAFGPRARDAFNKLNFGQLPLVWGRCHLDWSEPKNFKLDLNTDIDWHSFTYGNASFDRFRLALAYDGKRLLIPDAQLVSDRGTLSAELYMDSTQQQAKAKLSSTIDPTVFIGVFGEGADRFLNSCSFPQKGPVLNLDASGPSLKLDALTVKGTVAIGPFAYKNVAFKEAATSLTMTNLRLNLPDIRVKRDEGQAGGGIIYDFKNRTAQLVKFSGNVNVQEISPVLGGKFQQYVQPYIFSQPATVKVDGLVDLEDTKEKLDTNLTVDIDAPGTMKWRLFKVYFTFVKPKAQLKFTNRQMNLNISQCELFSGPFTGSLAMDLSKPRADYKASLNMTNADFAQLLKTVFNSDGSSGSLTGKATFSGTLDDLASINGSGEMSITDGNLYPIPFLGALSKVLNTVIPGFGIAKTNRAHSNFTLTKGYIDTKNLEIFSTNFTLIGEGRYQYIDDNLDLYIRANIRGIVGALLAPIVFPISKLFEYHGTGPLKNAKWESANF